MKQSTRIITWVVTAPITIVVVWFSASNLDSVTLHLWPLPFDLQLQIWLLTLIELLVGILLGALVAWIGDRRRRRDSRLLVKRIGELEQALAASELQAAELQRKLGEFRAPPAIPAA
jgi:uncharacterized integral membrane protein